MLLLLVSASAHLGLVFVSEGGSFLLLVREDLDRDVAMVVKPGL